MAYSAIAIKSTGAAWTWGANTSGQLGTNNTTSYSSPVAVVGSHNFYKVAMTCDSASIPTDTNTAGMKAADGSVWMWGFNNSGGLGDNATLTAKSSPIAVVGSHSFIQVICGGLSTIALKDDGSMWAWGANNVGQLGTNNTTSYSSPVAVVGNHSFKQIIFSNGGTFCVACKEDGSTWAWGLNTSGQLGNGDVTNRSSPTLVIGSHSFSSVFAGIFQAGGIKPNGEMWCWGLNDIGQLGNNTRTSYSSPVAVVGGHTFVFAVSGYSMTIGLKTDGTVWGMGRNANGQLGTGNTTSYSSPVAVIGSHVFTEIAHMRSVTIALKADGSAWGWGYNGYGQVGDNSRTDRNSPVAVVGGHVFTELWNQDVIYATPVVGGIQSTCVITWWGNDFL